MTDREFHGLLDEIMMTIEDEIDALDDDFDFDRSGGQLVITFPDYSQLILSRQVAQKELWIAAKSGGFHLALSRKTWTCHSSGEALWPLLARLFKEQWYEGSEAFNEFL
jgi:CyaY protein